MNDASKILRVVALRLSDPRDTRKGESEICYAAADELDRLRAVNAVLLEVLREVAECSEYWSEYDVPLGLHDRIKAVLAKVVT